MKKKAALRKGKLWDAAHPPDDEEASSYAGLTFFDPTAPRPKPVSMQVPEDMPEPLREPGPAPTLDAAGKCSECQVVVNLKLKLPHMWWCSWWESVEGKAHALPF